MSSLGKSSFLTSVVALAGVGAVGLFSNACANALLPKQARWQDKFTFFWVLFDALIHFSIESSFLYLSTFGRSVNTSTGFFADLWKEYALVDARWGVSDPTIVSLEILTVLGSGPLCCYIMTQIIKNDPSRHYWVAVLCTAELYGGWMVFCPEWLTGNSNLDMSVPFSFWVHVVVMNSVWVVIPLWLMWESYGHIAGSLQQAQANGQTKKD